MVSTTSLSDFSQLDLSDIQQDTFGCLAVRVGLANWSLDPVQYSSHQGHSLLGMADTAFDHCWVSRRLTSDEPHHIKLIHISAVFPAHQCGSLFFTRTTRLLPTSTSGGRQPCGE